MLIYCARPSHGCKELADALGIKRGGRRINRSYSGTVINWGTIDLPNRFRNATIINTPEAIAKVSDKLEFFRKVTPEYTKDSLTPAWTEDKTVAQGWIDNGSRVVARTVLNGSSGVGIHIADGERSLINAPLYVKYIPKDSEWRVHVFLQKKGPVVVDVQKKAKRNDVSDEEVNWEVRNLENGFIYKRHDITPPECVSEVALKCMSLLSLHFGAVDVIYNEKQKRAYVLEVNTAPGLEGTTVDNYAKAFRELLNT